MSENNFRKGPHSAKNKPTIEEVVEVTSGAVPASDERKTVILDEDLEGVELEDRVWLYWTRNKNFIITTIAAAFAIVIGVQGWKMYVAQKNAALASAYEAATTTQELNEFAKANSGTELAGVAILQNADSLYQQKNFAEAQKYYVDAQKNLSKSILLGRAKLGQAVSIYAAGDTAKGEAALKSIFEDATIAQSYKAQAGYLLGLAQKQSGKIDEAKATFEKVASEKGDGIFARIAQETLSKM